MSTSPSNSIPTHFPTNRTLQHTSSIRTLSTSSAQSAAGICLEHPDWEVLLAFVWNILIGKCCWHLAAVGCPGRLRCQHLHRSTQIPLLLPSPCSIWNQSARSQHPDWKALLASVCGRAGVERRWQRAGCVEVGQPPEPACFFHSRSTVWRRAGPWVTDACSSTNRLDSLGAWVFGTFDNAIPISRSLYQARTLVPLSAPHEMSCERYHVAHLTHLPTCPSPCRAVLPHAAPLRCSLACMAALACYILS